MKTNDDIVLRVQSRLTDRDWTLLCWLFDHGVLTTPQVTTALFPSPRTAQQRLLELMQMKVIDRFRPHRPDGGTYPWSYVLAHPGVLLVASSYGVKPPRPAETAARRHRLATSRNHAHTAGVNGFFTDLAGHARRNPPTRLLRWDPEPGRSASVYLQPDGYAEWSEQDTFVALLFEYDTGTEQLSVLTGKIERYQEAITYSEAPPWPLLFRLHSARREAALHERISDLHTPVPVATIAADRLSPAETPADRIWSIPGRRGLHRLIELRALYDHALATWQYAPAVLERRKRR
ncbi:replication-relaxation family protein [Catellatospora coxensis]|uniref:Protein involved in plasmid replication-relaxation n=1 Tax=Catellatospora coxensis TaxID=310354 RepID=A0A8J3KXD3_9ACTN|nr:replication-relaxation family protein [Catellatospora coxensis]GIG08062.1 hypothetical protein Cco03nite_47620 [Catellatospora coxensis]